MQTDFDIAVIGGGPNGATSAALLARHGGLPASRIALIAPELAGGPEPAGAPESAAGGGADAPPELRVAAISRASEWVLRNAGAWDHLRQERLCAYECMRVWHESAPQDGPGTLVFTAAELAEPNLGHIIENHALAGAGLASFTAQGGQVFGARLLALEPRGAVARLGTSAGEISVRLVVGADGARSQVRELLRLPVRTHDYQQSAIIATVATDRPHQHTAWQRFLGTGPLALLPLFNGCSSIVWSAGKALAAELMALPQAEFGARLGQASEHVLGATRLASERLAIPLRRATAGDLIAPRVALIGDAAHVIHPLAGQGVNLGFLDSAALCSVLAAGSAEREDPGAARLLTRYEQLRLSEDTLMSWSMSAFNELFTRAGGPLGWLAARALGVAGASGLVRRGFARRALGLAGDVPPLAQPAPPLPAARAAGVAA
jgi:2-polyprenylphenol 6-hydroxylase